MGAVVKVLVTGAAGFLGSHLCDQLLRKNYEVIGLDNLYTGAKKNLRKALQHPDFTFLLHDVTIPIRIEVDGIFNLACPASPIHYQKHPVQTLNTNIQGSINMLELARLSGARFFQASTSEVYGDPEVFPQSENYWGHVNPIGVRSCYDEGKRVAETLAFDYQRQYGVDIRVARIFNTYGPRMAMNDGRVVSNLIVQALTNQPMTVFGDGLQTRSFCFYSDLVDGLISLFEAEKVSGPVNLGNPEEITIVQLAEEIRMLTKTSVPIVYKSIPINDPRRRQPDILKAISSLTWQPKVRRIDGLRETVEYFRMLLRE